jgi:hypothetical protein
VIPQVIAVVAVGLLALSVVGLPLAIRQAVRWAFIEQAVLLDGKTGFSALSASSKAVSGQWLWAATAIVLLAGLTMLATPGVGALLVLTLRTVPLPYLNGFSALLFACVVPYLSIASALFYFALTKLRS